MTSRALLRVAAPAVLALLAWLAPVPPAGADPAALLGGFRPVAVGTGARTVLVNPAALDPRGRPDAVAEARWAETADESGNAGFDRKPTSWTLAAGFDGSGYAYQGEGDDVEGVSDWTVTWGERRLLPGGIALGLAATWAGGEDGGLDGTAGVVVPLGRSLSAAAVAADVLQTDVDGAPGERAWRTGVAWGPPRLGGRLTWDTLWENDRRPDTVHWVGAVVDGAGPFAAMLHSDLDRAWSAELAVGTSGVRLGGGWTRADDRDEIRVFLDWRGRPPHGGGWGPIPR
jgi:hypothetical protein